MTHYKRKVVKSIILCGEHSTTKTVLK